MQVFDGQVPLPQYGYQAGCLLTLERSEGFQPPESLRHQILGSKLNIQ